VSDHRTYRESVLKVVCNSMLHERVAVSSKTGIEKSQRLPTGPLANPRYLLDGRIVITKIQRLTSTPEIPTPTCAAWIILTSLAPSPIANSIAFWFFLTNFTTRAFCRGDTRPSRLWDRAVQMMTKDAQQITALHIMASSRNIFEMSFWSANPRLFPSVN